METTTWESTEMPMKVRYTTIDGEVISENRAGVERDYVPDPLGSTVALLNSSQTITDTFSYWPYGEIKARTGHNVTPFQFVGTFGYYTDSSGRNYVRARHLRKDLTRWQTEDQWQPGRRDYIYADVNPQSFSDLSGNYTVDKGGCGTNSIFIRPGPTDGSAVVVGPGGTMLDPSKVFPTLGVGSQAGCIAVNGGFFFDPPYKPGKPATPVGTVVDCTGKVYKDTGGGYSFPLLPVITDQGSVFGRPPTKPGGVTSGKTERTGACVDAKGHLVGIVAVGPPGVTLGGLNACMMRLCPKGSHPVLLDGGGSTQVIVSGTRPHPFPGFGGQHRPVHNWIVICPKQ